MKLIYRNFKVTNNNGKGFWVSLRELNYMLQKGIIAVDPVALEEYMNTKIPELSLTRMYENYNIVDEMIYTPTEEDYKILGYFENAGKEVRKEIEEEQSRNGTY